MATDCTSMLQSYKMCRWITWPAAEALAKSRGDEMGLQLGSDEPSGTAFSLNRRGDQVLVRSAEDARQSQRHFHASARRCAPRPSPALPIDVEYAPRRRHTRIQDSEVGWRHGQPNLYVSISEARSIGMTRLFEIAMEDWKRRIVRGGFAELCGLQQSAVRAFSRRRP
jgi:hypothetical protein